MNEALNYAVVQTELDSVFYQEFEQENAGPGLATASTEAIFKQTTIDRAAYIEEVFAGSPMFGIIGETATVPLSQPKVANKLTTYIKDFAQGVDISKDWFDDNMHGVWSRVISDLAIKARQGQNSNAFKIFRGATSTTLTADGVALGSASHPLIGGGTLSNLLTSSGLSDTTLNNAIIAMQTQKDQSGTIMGNMPAVLLVPPALFKTAIQLTDSALVADTSAAQNAVNVYRSAYGITVYQSPFISAAAGGSDTTWFLLARNHGITRIIRQGLVTNLRDWTFSNNRTYFYQANFREEVKVADYVGVIVCTS